MPPLLWLVGLPRTPTSTAAPWCISYSLLDSFSTFVCCSCSDFAALRDLLSSECLCLFALKIGVSICVQRAGLLV
uniref:Secreted protein n=1 Tax=Arundo donax TaxID=35708 RepID=A0A0A9DBG1_ARUDO